MAKLGDVCKITMGQSPDSATYNDKKEGLPFFQGNADFGNLHPIPRVWCRNPIKIANKNDILISVRAPIGALNIADCKCCIGRGLSALTADSRVCETTYLWYVIQSKVGELNAKGTGTTFKAIGRNVLDEVELPLPPLAVQRNISDILHKIDDMIFLRKRQLAKLDELIKARFVELFGDFKTNSKKWPVESFPQFAVIDCQMTTDYKSYADYPHIGIDSIEKETGELKGYRTVREDGVISGKYIFTPRHIIYSKIRPNLNKVALPDFSGLCSADAYPILPIPGKSNRVFLAYLLRSEFFLDYILKFCDRTNLPKVNRKEISGFQSPLPPIQLQDQFTVFVEQVKQSKSAAQCALTKLKTLKKALMQEYFG